MEAIIATGLTWIALLSPVIFYLEVTHRAARIRVARQTKAGDIQGTQGRNGSVR